MKKSSLPKYKFLLNANISIKIIPLVDEKSGFDFRHISEISSISLPDEEIVKIAKIQKRIIITHDLDYGEIYYLKEQGKLGVVMLRLKDQTSANVVRKLIDFFKSKESQSTDLSVSLIIISEDNTRVFSPK